MSNEISGSILEQQKKLCAVIVIWGIITSEQCFCLEILENDMFAILRYNMRSKLTDNIVVLADCKGGHFHPIWLVIIHWGSELTLNNDSSIWHLCWIH